MESMYERIKKMSQEEMQKFIYWVYMNGHRDAKDELCDSFGMWSYFGGAILEKNAEDVIPEIAEMF